MSLLAPHRQLALHLPEPPRRKGTHGGARPGAGRKPVPDRKRKLVAHRARAPHVKSRPVHVTLRAKREAAFFRREAVFPRLRDALRRASRAEFRVVHFSVQGNHVHLLVEAGDARVLRRGMQALTTRLARVVNDTLGRRGRVWADRYHRHDLGGPAEVRRALVYVLQNGRKHGVVPRHALDPMSSARWVAGWNARGARLARALPRADDGFSTAPVAAPRTWLLREGWLTRGGGPLDPREEPRPL